MRRSRTLDGVALLTLLALTQGPDPPPDPVGWIVDQYVRLLLVDATHGYWLVRITVRIGRHGPEFALERLWRASRVGSRNADEAIRWSRAATALEVRRAMGLAEPPAGWLEGETLFPWCWSPEVLRVFQSATCGDPEPL